MVKAILVLMATLGFVAGAYLVTFTGFAPDQFPVPQVDPPVQPAGYAFAIWGLIFLGLISSAIFGMIRRTEDPGWDAVRSPLIASFAIGAIWNAVANQSPVWATVLIWIMLGTAVLALLRAPQADRAWLSWPLGLYTGWLTAASCVSLGLLAAGYGLAGPTIAGLAAVVLAAGLSVIQVRKTVNPAFVGAVVWALIALIGKNLDGAPAVSMAAALATALLVYAAVRRLRSRATAAP